MTNHIRQLSIFLGTLVALLLIAYFIPSFGSNLARPTNYPFPLVKYTEKIHHIFFHSLVVYPEILEKSPNRDSVNMYMINTAQFKDIIEKLYKNNFILINSDLLYSVDPITGKISKKDLYIPQGKKPLIISIDDPAYPIRLYGSGFARKMFIQDNKLKTEVIDPSGTTTITEDGDMIPIVENFLEKHPDFSFKGARGIIGLTGFEGTFGYRTETTNASSSEEKAKLKPILDYLKNKGWVFASHSFSHMEPFLNGTISYETLKWDIDMWNKEVRPLIGNTRIFIGPFGVIFREGDIRRQLLIDNGFKELYGVGMDETIDYHDNYFAMDRINIDGFRLANNKKQLERILGI